MQPGMILAVGGAVTHQDCDATGSRSQILLSVVHPLLSTTEIHIPDFFAHSRTNSPTPRKKPGAQARKRRCDDLNRRWPISVAFNAFRSPIADIYAYRL